MKTVRIMAVAALFAGNVLAMQVAQAQPGITRIDVQQQDISAPGREVIQVRVDFDKGASAANHSHPGEEVAYVLEGTLEYKLEGRPPVILNVGDALFIPAGTNHAVKNTGSGKASELATYIVQKGKPLLVNAK